jgi:hypothetical protein
VRHPQLWKKQPGLRSIHIVRHMSHHNAMRISISRRTVLIVVVAGAVAAGLFVLGRATADTKSARATGYRAGNFAGLQTGIAQGREEGRALQAGSVVAADSQQPVQDGFDKGYAAGTADAFGSFDGGWQVQVPYVVSVTAGSGGVVYRFQTRDLVQPGINYYLCPDGHTICQSPRH